MAQLKTESPEALVIHCSDPRFQQSFKELLHETLGLTDGEYIPIVIPGSVSAIGLGIERLLPKNFKILRDQLELMLSTYHESKELRLIIINHEDCRGYQNLLTRLTNVLPAFARNAVGYLEGDLAYAGSVVKRLASAQGINCSLELYMALIAEGGEIVFNEVKAKEAAA